LPIMHVQDRVAPIQVYKVIGWKVNPNVSVPVKLWHVRAYGHQSLRHLKRLPFQTKEYESFSLLYWKAYYHFMFLFARAQVFCV